MPNIKTVSVENQFSKAQTTLIDKMPAVPLNEPQGIKAIGPRVTFHFITEDWNENNTYEAYDVVQIEGASYVAIKPVPKNIEITNTDYWFKWSEPNAQWAQLLDTVNSFDGRISSNTNNINTVMGKVDALNQNVENLLPLLKHSTQFTMKKSILLGDSWCTENYAYGEKSFMRILAEMLELDYTNLSVGGTGYSTSGSNGTYRDILTNYATTNDPDEIRYIFLYGSINDMNSNSSTNSSNFANTINYCVNTFTNATIYVIPTIGSPYLNRCSGNGVNNISPWLATSSYQYGYIYNLNNKNVVLVDGIFGALQFANFNDVFNQDYIHPNTKGAKILAMIVYQKLMGSNITNISLGHRIYSDSNNPFTIKDEAGTKFSIINAYDTSYVENGVAHYRVIFNVNLYNASTNLIIYHPSICNVGNWNLPKIGLMILSSTEQKIFSSTSAMKNVENYTIDNDGMGVVFPLNGYTPTNEVVQLIFNWDNPMQYLIGAYN